MRCQLLACSKKGIIKGVDGQPEAVRVDGADGKQHWIPIRYEGDLPVIITNYEKVNAARIDGAISQQARCKSTSPQEIAVGGGMRLSPAIVKAMDANMRAEVLQMFHLRLAHATGRRLYLTLKEKGWEGVFKEKECSEVTCSACQIMNRRKVKIPAVVDRKRESLLPGDLVFQDLLMMPRGIGGFTYVSVIIDAHTRRVSLMALKSKDEALDH